MDNELRELVEQIRDIGEDLAPDLMELIGQALEVEVQRWRGQAPVDSGTLKNSIQKRMLDAYTWGVEFKEYGLYQNFGVAGINNKTNQIGVANFVPAEFRPREGARYGFTSAPIGGKLPLDIRFGIAYNGLNAKTWFAATDAELDIIIQRVADRALQSTQL